MLVLAHLQALVTRDDAPNRRGWKMRLVKGLYRRGLDADTVRRLFKFIDWLLWLPPDLERPFWQEVHDFEQEQRMPFVTSVERIGIEKGLHEGLLSGIQTALRLKFNRKGQKLMTAISQIDDVEALRNLLRVVERAKTVEQVQSAVEKHS